MHLAVGDQAHQVERLAPFLDAIHRGQQNFITEKLAGGDFVVNSRNVHADHAAGADIQVAHFGISHHSAGKPTRVPEASSNVCG